MERLMRAGDGAANCCGECLAAERARLGGLLVPVLAPVPPLAISSRDYQPRDLISSQAAASKGDEHQEALVHLSGILQLP